MPQHTTTQTVLFPDLFSKSVVATFDQEAASSDGGAILLKAAERRVRVIGAMAHCLPDDREPGKVRHELEELIRQRVYALACGYPDCNDAARLKKDPIHKMLVGRDPVEGEDLASQPTLSRFENSVGAKEVYRLAEELADKVIERQRRRRWGRRVSKITVDLDSTHDPTYGGQQLSLFNGKYGTWCYLPILGFLRFNEEGEQYLFAAVLRPGTAPAKKGTLGILRRVLPKVREAFPRARILVRLDAGFASPEIFEFLEEEGLEYVVAMGKNKVLERLCEEDLAEARKWSEWAGRGWKIYGEGLYQAGSWPHERRVVYKAEVVCLGDKEPRDNPRFMITNLKLLPRNVYEKVYCRRGDVENRIKELKESMAIGRTSCTRFWANQFRVLLTAAAYVLMQELRHSTAGTSFARAQAATLREHLLKIGVWVKESVRRIVLHLPEAYPYREEWRRVATALGAKAG
jgi:hypothetical protein